VTTDRETALENTLRLYHNALLNISRQRDCDYCDMPREQRPTPCPCPTCEAKAVLEQAVGWRYIGAHFDRVVNGFNPRETRMHLAWKQEADDRVLGLLLNPEPPTVSSFNRGHYVIPTVRDWYVATTVVQWLATNVGMGVLEAAGFKYQHWDEDRKTLEEKRKEQTP
jgi:hypothetical protein